MSAPPPPPPPHGEMPRSGGLPPGKYDIFVIPEHSAGSGFLYLPSLQPNVNSFAAGFASALILVAVFQSMAPAFRAWWESFNGLGNMGITLLIIGVGFGAWALGRTQTDGSSNTGPKPNTSHPGSGPGGFGSQAGATPNASPPPQPGPSGAAPNGGAQKSQSSWQRPPPENGPNGTKRPEATKGAWEKARDEMKKKEEERKAKEADQKRREELAKRLAELRAKEAKERAEREKEKERKDKEAAAKKAADDAKKSANDKAKSRVGSSYAYSGAGEKMNMWPNGRPSPPKSPATPKGPPSPGKRPPAPTARTYISTDEEAYSYRPYDQPKRRPRRPSGGSIHSDASWAASQTTARTSPPPSFRGAYSTKDPDKIVIQAVYLFMNQYAKTPASQLISGAGTVTDGLILRITTEGLFIDDDVRGVPQREWDVKAWTLKMAEVWCPPHCLNSASASNHHSHPNNKSANLLYKMATGRTRNADRDASKPFTGEEADAYLADMLKACKDCCRLGLCDQKFSNTNIPSSTGQAGEWKDKGLHVLRATVRDQDGKRYLFVIDETEHWKVGAGLQRLRKGTQARQLGLCSMTPSEAKRALETLGWGV